MSNKADYLHCSDAYFWEWADEGTVLAIQQGHTIAYSAYVEEVMGILSAQGLPAFGALLLALYATNDAANAPLDPVVQLVETRMHTTHSYRILIPEARSFLELLQGLPPVWRTGRNRMQVLAAVFASAHNRQAASRSRVLCTRFHRLRLHPEEIQTAAGFPREVFHEDFRTLALLMRRFPTGQSIIDAALALPDVEAPDLDPLPAPNGPAEERDYLEELLARPVSFPVAALVPQLWSGLHIPHHQAAPSRQPVGGVSDLANKGPFDRLLLTEFANDDTVFASRLANNEALFINREIPPERSNRERVLLIDVSIRNWGTPRTLAFALLLAIARHPRTDIPCRAFTVGTGYRQVFFDTPAQLIDALQHLEPVAHAAEGLRAFLESNEAGAGSELLYLSAAELGDVPAVRQVLQEHVRRFHYWLHTDAQGGIDLYARQGTARRLLQRLALPLEELWKQKRREASRTPAQQPPVKEETNGFRRTDLPLLLPMPQSYRHLLMADRHTALMLTRERTVLRAHIQRQEKGHSHYWGTWELVASGLPAMYSLAATAYNQAGDILLALYEPQPRRIIVYNLNDGSTRSVQLRQQALPIRLVRKMLGHGTDIYLCNRGRIFALTWEHPELLHVKEAIPVEIRKAFHENAWPELPICSGDGSIRNLRCVGISFKGELMINGHVLTTPDVNREMWLDVKVSNRYKALAARMARGVFRFRNGNTVTLDPNGLLILQSSEPARPPVYLTALLQNHLGMAAGDVRAGNRDFFREGHQVLTHHFYETYIEPFIKEIVNNGTAPGAE